MIDDRVYLLDRCLRLEARLLGITVDSPPEVASVVPPVPTAIQHPRGTRRAYRNVEPADIAQMRALRASGLSYRAIAQRVAFADATVRTYVRDVQVAP